MKDYQYHIFSPYRVCPLGAHVDHQHGLVTGFAIDKGVDLYFNVNDNHNLNANSYFFSRDFFFPLREFYVQGPETYVQGP